MTIKSLVGEISKANQQLIDSIQEFKDILVVQNLTGVPDAVNKSLTYIQNLNQPTEWKRKLKEEIKGICKAIKSRKGLIKTSGNDHFEKMQAMELLGNIYASYQLLKKYLSNPSQAVENWQFDRLRLEQQVICKVEAATKVLNEVLTRLKEKSLDYRWSIPSKCYISYARTKHATDNEHWVELFLEHLRGHLRQAGINVLLDSKDNPVGGNPFQFMNKIKKSDCVIVIGTEALFQQHESGIAGVCNELVLINQNREQKQGKILPILLNGSLENSLPPYFLFSSNIVNWQEYSYIVNLKKLLAGIYEIGSDNEEYPQIWSAFEQKYFSLVTGFPEKAVRSRLILEERLSPQQKELSPQQAIELLTGINENKFNQLPVKELDQTGILTWEKLVHCVKAKYIQEDKFETVLGKAQEIASCYVNLAIVEEKAQKEKEEKLVKEGYYQAAENRPLDKKPSLEREEWLNSYEEIHGVKTFILPQDIFNLQNGKELKRQLILGRAGIGKSIFCQYLAYQWAKEGWWKDQPFKLLIWVPLRQLTNERIYSKEGKKAITLGRVFYEQFKEQIQDQDALPVEESANWIKALDELIKKHRSEILYVLDGFDEVAHVCQLDDSQKTRQTEILRLLLNQEQIVITSRPYYIDHYLTSRGMKIGRRLENIGFVNKDIHEYVQHYTWKSLEQQEILQSWLNSNSLMRGIAHIPINLALLCRYWSKQKSKEYTYISMTDLYKGLVGDLLYEYLGKQSGKGHINFISSTTNSILNNKKVQPTLQFLEKLAFLQMQEESLLISKERIAYLLEEFENQVETNEWQGFKSVLGAGLLVSSDREEQRFEDKREHYFIHLTFQEFLAARYIARLFEQNDESSRKVALLEKGGLRQKINNPSLEIFMRNHKYDLRYEIVWWFVAGLLKEHGKGIERFFNSLRSEPRELLGSYDALLWIKCLEESQLTDNLGEELKKDLIKEIKDITQFVFDLEVYIFANQYSNTFLEYLFSSLMVYEELDILQTQEAVKESLSILGRQKNLPSSVLNNIERLLRDESEYTRGSALEALGQQPNLSANVLNEMVRLLRDEDKGVRGSAQSALGQQRDLSANVLNEMVRLLRDENKYTRGSALEALGQQSNLPANILNEIVTLLRDEEWIVRRSAQEALGQQPNLSDSVLKEMVRLLRDEEWIVRRSALSALGQQPNLPTSVLNKMVKLLRDENKDVRRSVLYALGQQQDLSDSILNEIVRLLSDENKDVRSSALYALGQQRNLPVSVLNEMVRLLRDEEWIVRHSALSALGQQPNLPTSVLNKMVKLLRDENKDVRRSVLYALGQQRNLSDSVLKEMVRLLSDENKDVRSLAQEALGRQPNLSDSVLKEMVRLLSNKNLEVRCSVLEALGKRPNLSDRVLNKMMRLLRDEKEDVRSSALKALGRQPNLSSDILIPIISYINNNENRLNFEYINFINLHLISILSNQELRSKLILMPVLFDIILNCLFPSKNIMYLENNQTLIIRLGQQFKQITLSDKEQLVQVFAKQRKAKPVYHSGKRKFKIGDYVGAIADFTEALNLEYFDVKECYFFRIRARILVRDYLGVIMDASEVISLNPRNVYAYYCRAWAYLFLSKIKFALKDVEQVFQLNKTLDNAYIIRSLIYFKQDKLKEAIAICEDLVSSEDSQNLAIFLLAQFYRFQGNETAYQTELVKVQKFVDKDPFCNLIEEWMFPPLNDALATVTNQLSAISLEKKELYEELKSNKQNEEEHDASSENSPIFTPFYQSQHSSLTMDENKQDKPDYQPSY